jgi:lia operon protein LiaG
MKTVLIVATVALAASLSGRFVWPWSDVHSVQTSSYSLPATGTIAVRDSSGDVKLEGWDRDSVQLIVRKQATTDADLDSLNAAVTERGGVLGVVAQYPEDCRNCDISFEIKMPRGAHVVVDSSSGDVSVSNAAGPVRVGTASGDIEVRASAGSTVLHSSSGDITVSGCASGLVAQSASGDIDTDGLAGDASLVSASGSVKASYEGWGRVRTVRIESTSGDIELVVPRGSGFKLEAETQSGSIDSNLRLPIDDRDDGAAVNAQVGSASASVQMGAQSGDISITMR